MDDFRYVLLAAAAVGAHSVLLCAAFVFFNLRALGETPNVAAAATAAAVYFVALMLDARAILLTLSHQSNPNPNPNQFGRSVLTSARCLRSPSSTSSPTCCSRGLRASLAAPARDLLPPHARPLHSEPAEGLAAALG
jgi:hypothetical protein